MKDVLTFYRCDTQTLEDKIMTRDMIEGSELAGHLERLSTFLGSFELEGVALGELFEALEAVTDTPFRFLMGMGERRLEPAGPVTYCGRQMPSEIGEMSHAIGKVMQLQRKTNASGAEADKLARWKELREKIGLDRADPACLSRLRRFLDRFRDMDPEVVSVYERW